MSRISATRSTTSTANSFSRLRCCAGVSSSSKIDDVDVERLGELAQLLGLALARCRSRGRASSRRCSSTSTGSAPAVSARSASSSSDASASSAVRAPKPVPTSSARCWTTSRSTSVAVSRRRLPVRRGDVTVDPAGQRAPVDVDVEDVHDRTAEADRVAPSSTTRSPPGTCTVTRSPTRPRRWATAAAAHAPVPHDSVSPTPRSQTRIASASGARRRATNSTFVRFGKRGRARDRDRAG